jgi:hypothetical protein
LNQFEKTRNEQAEEIEKLEEKLTNLKNGNIDNLLLEQLQEQNKEYKQIISKLEAKIEKQYKTIQELKNQDKNTDKDKQITNKTFFCDSCQLTKQGEYIKRKVDAPFEPRLHGRICYLCSSCSPYIKELNDTTFEKDNNPYQIN